MLFQLEVRNGFVFPDTVLSINCTEMDSWLCSWFIMSMTFLLHCFGFINGGSSSFLVWQILWIANSLGLVNLQLSF